jgi:RNA polymerase sigma factor (sigma-70 family)
VETLSFNESSLVLACKKGVGVACGQLYQAYVTQVYRFVYLRTRHKETAEDITSETFLKAFAHFENFDTNRLLLPWLYRIAHNALIDHWRKERPGFSLDENWDSPSEDPTPLEIAGILEEEDPQKQDQNLGEENDHGSHPCQDPIHGEITEAPYGKRSVQPFRHKLKPRFDPILQRARPGKHGLEN